MIIQKQSIPFIIHNTSFIIILLGVLTIQSCQQDTNTNYAQDSLDQYLEDYESPKFKWGMLDMSGKHQIQPIYDDLMDALNPYFIPAMQNGKWGFIDKDGKTKIAHQFKLVQQFQEGIAWVTDFENHWYSLDINGVKSDSISILNAQPFSEGLSGVRTVEGWKFVNSKHEVIIPGPFESVSAFANNLSICKQRGRYGVIDIEGKTILPFQYRSIKNTRNGYLVKNENGYQYLDSQGQPSLQSIFEKALPFKGDKTAIKENGNWFLIDDRGKRVGLPDCKTVVYLNEERWKFKTDKGWFIIDENGQIQNDDPFESTYKYNEGILPFAIDKLWGYADLNCNVIIKPQYPLAWSYHKGYSRIIKDRLMQVMDREGNINENIKHIELRDFHNGIARFQYFPFLEKHLNN